MNMKNHTKQFAIFLITIIIIMLAFCNQSFADVDIDSYYFPDEIFRNYVKNNFDKNNDDILDDNEIAGVTTIPVGFTYTISNDAEKITIQKSNYNLPSGIKSLSGIDNFPNLTTLACINNDLETLDIYRNDKLVALFCSGNNLTSTLYLESAKLQYVECDNNHITDIYFPNESSLEYLSCNSTDISDSMYNIPGSLKYFYFSYNPNIKNPSFLSTGTALEHIWCVSDDLQELSLSNNTNLKILHCENNRMPAISLSNNSALEIFMSEYQKIIPDREISDSSREDYPYGFDLYYIVYSSTENIYNIAAFASDGSEIQTQRDTDDPDVVRFAAEPAIVTYDYDTGLSGKALKVMLIFGSYNPITAGLAIDSTNFPDSNFRTHIANYFDTDSDGFLSRSEISNVTAIPSGFTLTENSDGSVTANYSTTLANVSDLTGIEKFSSLLRLGLDNNNLSSVNLSSNSALESLFIEANSLSNLDLSSNAKLRHLNISANNLSSLNLSANTALTYLDCSSNKLSILDLSANTSLAYLDADGQILDSKQALTFTGSASYPWQFDFKTIVTEANAANISSVTATDESASYVSVSFNAGSDAIATFASVPAKATYIYETGISGFTMDVTIAFSEPEIPNFGYPINASYFPDENFRSYVLAHFDTNSDGFISSDEIANVTAIPENYTFTPESESQSDSSSRKTYASDLGTISDFTGLELFTSLKNLGADNNSLKNLDVSKNTLLEILVCDNNSLETLDVTNNTLLKILKCDTNSLSEIDVSKNSSLIYLNCSVNNLSALDVANNSQLEYLYLQENSVSKLDLSSNTALKNLDCSSNDIAIIDLSSNSSLTSFSGSTQVIDSQPLTQTDDSDYPYEFFFSLLSADSSKISDVQAYDDSESEIDTTYSDGVAKFASLPSSVTYHYSTGNSGYTLQVSFGIAEAPVITTSELPNGTTGESYSATISATSGFGKTLTWTYSGELPDGLSLNSESGEISGTPTVAGTFNFTITVSDTYYSTSRAFTLTIESSVINQATAPKIITTNLSSGRVGVEYSIGITATGTTPITFSLDSGSLPGGLTLSSSGIISGRATATGTFTFTIQAANAINSDTKTFTLTIGETADVSKPSITTGTRLPSATRNKNYRSVIYSMGTKPVTWSLSSGNLPDGLKLTTGGVINGTVSSTATLGDYEFQVRAVNVVGNDERKFTISVLEDTTDSDKPTITTSSNLGTITQNVAYSTKFSAKGNTPITWQLLSGSRFPDGLVLNSNGTITGTPVAIGYFSFKVQATNSSGSDTRNFTLRVASASGNSGENDDPVAPETPTPTSTIPLITTNPNRNIASLTPQERAVATSDDMIIAAILDEVRVFTMGYYSFDVSIDAKVPTGYELVWNAFPRIPDETASARTSDSSSYANFTDIYGNRITTVSTDRRIKAYSYLTPNVYGPVISAKQSQTSDNSDNSDNSHNHDSDSHSYTSGKSSGGGGCNSGNFALLIAIPLLFRRRNS